MKIEGTNERIEVISKAQKNVKLLGEMSRVNSGLRFPKRLLKSIMLKNGIRMLEIHDLRRGYDMASEYLKKEAFRETDGRRTTKEKAFVKDFKREFTRESMSDCWVGPFQVDLLVHTVRGANFHAISYEIDGGIHNDPQRALRDNFKEEYLRERFGIITKRVENHDIKNGVVRREVTALRNLPAPDSRTKANLLRSIYIETIAVAEEISIRIHEERPSILEQMLDVDRKVLEEMAHATTRSMRVSGVHDSKSLKFINRNYHGGV